MNYRELLKDKKRVVIKVGSSSLIHKETGRLDLRKLEVLVREISDLHNQGKDVVLVTSGAVAVGSAALGLNERPRELKVKQACSAVGQARLMMIYQKLFAEYNQMAAQILMTKNTMVNNLNRMHARNTFEELLTLNTIPVVNENDSISSFELEALDSFGDNDTLSAVIAALIGADLLILLSDIDGLFTDDPNTNPDAKFIDTVEKLDEKKLLTLNGSSYVLTEFHPSMPYSMIINGVRELTMAQYTPILAHFERYTALREQGRVEELIQAGALMQMNYKPIGGKWYEETTRWCRKMLKEGNVHFLGSDMHNMRTRKPELMEASHWMEKHLDNEYIKSISYANAEKILANKIL